jgi:hypothetical protein
LDSYQPIKLRKKNFFHFAFLSKWRASPKVFPFLKEKKSTAIKEKATAKKTSDFLNKKHKITKIQDELCQ